MAVRLSSLRAMASALVEAPPEAPQVFSELAVHLNGLERRPSSEPLLEDLRRFLFEDPESKKRPAGDVDIMKCDIHDMY